MELLIILKFDILSSHTNSFHVKMLKISSIQMLSNSFLVIVITKLKNFISNLDKLDISKYSF